MENSKTWVVRGVAGLGLVALGWFALQVLAPRGLAWIVWTVAALGAAFFLLELFVRARRRASEKAEWARWKQAVDDPKIRRTVISELERSFARARILGPRMRLTQARLATALAELHEADGKSEKAIQVLAKVPVEELEPLQAAVVRCARAQAYLHAGDVDGAAATIAPVGDVTGDPVVDANLALVRGAIALEEGDRDGALSAARSVAAAAEPNDELWDDARGLEAACLADAGDAAGARAALEAVEQAGRQRLGLLGSARLRALVSEHDP